MREADPQTTALLVVDAQKAFLDRETAYVRRNNPDAVPGIAALLDGVYMP